MAGSYQTSIRAKSGESLNVYETLTTAFREGVHGPLSTRVPTLQMNEELVGNVLSVETAQAVSGADDRWGSITATRIIYRSRGAV